MPDVGCCRSIYSWVGLFILVLLVPAACSTGVEGPAVPSTPAQQVALPPPVTAPAQPAPQPPATMETPTAAGLVQATPANRWEELFRQTPFPYTVPLPPPTTTSVDGVYTKVEDRGTPIPCRRCPDFKPEGGIWKLSMDRGIFRIFYHEKGWRSLASYSVTGDRFEVFNDPNCLDVVGTYTWKRLEDGAIVFQVVEDTCHVGRRALNLTSLPWRSCRPDDKEAAVTDHWPKPPGC